MSGIISSIFGANQPTDETIDHNRLPWSERKVLGFCSHKPESYPEGEEWLATFSQWYPAPIKMQVDDHEYEFVNNEQWMMWNKAKHFGATETMAKILATTDPKEMRRLGREEIPNYDDEQWKMLRYQIVWQGNQAKFSQHHDLMGHLLNTKHQTIAEAAHYDRIWGIGLRRTDPASQDETKWKGKNLLGKVLMQVRGQILRR